MERSGILRCEGLDVPMTRPSPTRIASLLASGTEIVCGLGLANQLIAISHECDFPPEILDRPRVTVANVNSNLSSVEIDEQVRSMCTRGEALYRIDAKRLVELQPDVIITQAQCDVCAVRFEDVANLAAKEPSLAQARIVTQNPTRLEHLFDDIRAVAMACDAIEAGDRYEASLRERIARIAGKTAGIPRPDRPRAVCIEWIEPLMIAANWMPDLIDLAGGRCDLTEPGKHSGYSKWADVVAYDPQVIVVMPCGFDLPRTIREAKALPSLPQWDELSAVREGRAFAADGNAYFNRSGPSLIDSLELLAEMIHPGLFPAGDSTSSMRYQKLSREMVTP